MPALLYRNGVDGQLMALVPAGPAVFGAEDDDPDAFDGEKPQFEAQLPGYYLGIYCVTNAQYARFLSVVSQSGSDVGHWILLDYDCHVVVRGRGYEVDDEGYGDHPMVQVSWFGAETYCGWAGLRLPTELEWEKGARGPDGVVYPWGDEWDETKCRHDGNRSSEETCAVWDYPQGCSVYGMYNMSGSVWEWCADWYDPDAYRRYATGDLTPPAEGEYRVLRGGSWRGLGPRGFRSAYRAYNPDYS